MFPDGNQQNLALCGLLDYDSWEQALAVSPMLLGMLFLVLVFGVLLWPLLKLTLLSVRERFRFSDLHFLLFGCWAALMTALVFTMAVATHFKLVETTQKTNKYVAGHLKKTLSNELAGLYAEMMHLDRLPVAKVHGSKLYQKPDKAQRPYVASESFEFIFWIDPESGDQIGKASVKQKMTPYVNVKIREYFTRARDRRLWKLDALAPPKLAYVQNVRSITTAELGTVISAVSSSRCVKPDKEEVALYKRMSNKETCPDGHERAIVAAQARLIAVTDPVLPPGVSLAVIDPQGLAIFHSDSNRTLKDNLFDELSDGDRLREAVTVNKDIHAGVTRSFDASYLGRAHRVYVTPMGGGFPWHIVVLSDNEQSRTVVLEAVGHAMMLTVFFVVGMLLLILLYSAFAGQNLPRWFWPTHGSGGYHAWWSLALAVTLAVFASGVALTNADTSLAVSIIVSIIIVAALLITSGDDRYWQLRARAEGTWPSSSKPCFWYIIASLLLWLNIAAVPAFGIYKNALAGSLTEAAAHTNLVFAKDRQRWEEQMRDYYQDIPHVVIPPMICARADGAEICEFGIYKAPDELPIKADEVGTLWRFLADYKPDYNNSAASRRYLAPAKANGATPGGGASPATRVVSPPLPNLAHPASVLIGLVILGLGLVLLRYVCRKLYFLDIEPAGALSVDEIMGADQCVLAFVSAVRSSRLFGADVCSVISSRGAKPVYSVHYKGVTLSRTNNGVTVAEFKAGIDSVATLARLRERYYRLLVLAPLDQRAVSLAIPGSFTVRWYPLPPRREPDTELRTGGDFWTRHMSAPVDRRWCNRELESALGAVRPDVPDILHGFAGHLSKREVLARLRIIAHDYYSALWKNCSRDEQFVLLQLSQEAVVNPKEAPLVRGLLQRGLIRRDPALRPMNDSFASWITETGSVAELRQWERSASGAQWSQLRWVLAGILVLVFGFLCLAEPDLVKSGLAFLSVAGVTIPTLLKLASGTRLLGGEGDG